MLNNNKIININNILQLKKYKLEFPVESCEINSIPIVKYYNTLDNKYTLEWDNSIYDLLYNNISNIEKLKNENILNLENKYNNNISDIKILKDENNKKNVCNFGKNIRWIYYTMY